MFMFMHAHYIIVIIIEMILCLNPLWISHSKY